jgi:3-keto-5-aminohexanoate cleavage enzyme
VPQPVIVTCAVAGGIVTGNPNQPHTRDDVIREVRAARDAGAAIAHIHARLADGGISQAPEDYLAIKQALRSDAADIVLNFTTGGKLGMPPAQRRLSLQAEPEVASLNCGSLNFGPDGAVFLNPPALIEDLADEMDRRGIVREYECFDFGMAVTAARMAGRASGSPGVMHLVLGVLGGAPPTVESVTMFARMVPDRVPWMATAIGRHNFPIMAVTMALGGHVRTGLEDVVYSTPGEYASSNAVLVERAVALARAIGRPVATPAQAREILGARFPRDAALDFSATTMETRGLG